MPHRIEIELTSRTDDSSWTWRAAGAKQPRGSLSSSVLPPEAAVGDVLRAEADFAIDGITILSTAPLRSKSTASRRSGGAERIEIVGPPRSKEDISVVLAPKSRSRRPFDEEAGGGRRPRGGRPQEGGRGGRTSREARPGRPERGEGPDRGARPERGERPSGPGRPGGREQRRLQPVTTHRNAALASLGPEQLPVAEQLLRGGIPAVRQAIEEQNARARSEGQAEVSADLLLGMAEQLLPLMTLATWKDRAAAAQAAGKETPLRELRSIVTSASTVTLDEEGRTFATALREALDARVTALRDGWVARITAALGEDRVIDALRTSTRPPEPATRCPADLAVRLAEAAGKAMRPEAPAADWLALLTAVLDSPVRRTVKPAGLPTELTEEVQAAVRQAAGLVPELAKLLGLPIPPPPGPRRVRPTGVGA